MKNILIAITSRKRTIQDRVIDGENNDYIRYVHEIGNAIPCIVHALTKEEAETIAETMDGLLVTGGMDVNPILYKESNQYSFPINEEDEQSDVYLYNAFKALGKPVFGICRGCQIINVIEGGTLYQDLKQQTTITDEHNQANMNPPFVKNEKIHDCTFVRGMRTFNVFGDRYAVNSFHHQAIKDPAPSFLVSAYSIDGIIEAIEKNNIIAVQWHPEKLQDDEKHAELMKRFIEDCENYKK